MISFLIRFGNHWLLTDDHQTEIRWIEDSAVASRHSKEWAEAFAEQMRKENKDVEIYDEIDWCLAVEHERARRLKSMWLAAFEKSARYRYLVQWDVIGLWTNAHMLYRQGYSVEKAVEILGDKDHLNLELRK